jgi:hypothetical protein
MALYHYDGTQKNPPNYRGIRVNVMVMGKVKQKWFNFRTTYTTEAEQKKVREEAEELNMRWLMEKNLNKKEPEEKDRCAIFNTGVVNLKLKFLKKRTYRDGNLWTHYTPVFNVQFHKNKKNYHKVFNIKTRGYDMAWFQACNYIAEYKGVNIDSISHKKPPVEKMIMILDWQRRAGNKIPTHRLPDEIFEMFRNDPSESTQKILQNILLPEEREAMIEQRVIDATT